MSRIDSDHRQDEKKGQRRSGPTEPTSPPATTMQKVVAGVFVTVVLGAIALAAFGLWKHFGNHDRFVPPDGTCLVIIGQDKAAIDAYAANMDKRPSGVMLYTSLNRLEGLWEPADCGAGIQDAAYLKATCPHAVLQVGLYLEADELLEIKNGKYDAKIDRLGEWIKASGRPVFLRPGYEADLPEKKYDPTLYKEAFQHIRKRLDAKKVTNVAFVFHSYAGDAAGNPGHWYPGDKYVDWIAVSYFSPKQPHLDTIAEFAKVHGKAFMVAESSPHGIGTTKGQQSWDDWFVPFFSYVDKHNVQAFSYIDCDWDAVPMFRDKRWGDARLAVNETIRKNWTAKMTEKKYLHESKDLFKKLGFNP